MFVEVEGEGESRKLKFHATKKDEMQGHALAGVGESTGSAAGASGP